MKPQTFDIYAAFQGRPDGPCLAQVQTHAEASDAARTIAIAQKTDVIILAPACWKRLRRNDDAPF
ncbi:MAG: hypothetical protein NXH83_13840 [Rhodobacteraceae bacterium]|nr:hypothetical protein [Paracoccaceae bacterium]